VIVVSSYWLLDEAIKQFSPTHLISLMDTPDAVPTPKGIAKDNHLKLGFHDVIESTTEKTPPNIGDIRKLISFGKDWAKLDTPIVVHCTAGVSRSPAAALILSVLREPDSEARLATYLRMKAPYCVPNELMIELADTELGLGERLIKATQNMKEPEDQGTPQPFTL
jgi:predicted protein tyrosine phosphatase